MSLSKDDVQNSRYVSGAWPGLSKQLTAFGLDWTCQIATLFSQSGNMMSGNAMGHEEANIIGTEGK